MCNRKNCSLRSNSTDKKGALLSLALLFILMLLLTSSASSETFVLPAGVKEIEAEAFFGDANLDDIVLPDGIKRIGERAFSHTSLQRIYLPDSLEFISSNAFQDSPLVFVTATEGSYAYNWAVTNGYIESSDAAIIAQGRCGSDLTWTLSDNGVLKISGSGDMDYFDITYETSYDNSSPWSSFKDQINKVIINEGVTSVGGFAFFNCRYISSVYLPSSLQYINDDAFNGCTSLTRIIIPEGVTGLGLEVFHRCSSLSEVKLPSTLQTWPEYSPFTGDNLINIHLDTNNQTFELRDGVLFKKQANILVWYPEWLPNTGYSVPEECTEICTQAFRKNSHLVSLNIPNTVKKIGGWAFQSCSSLKTATMPTTLDSMGAAVFMDCTSLETVNVPEGITGLSLMFRGCLSLKELSLPTSVKKIYWEDFIGCNSLMKIVIPATVESIAENTFSNCENLVIYCYEDTVAHQFAIANDIPFVIIKNPELVSEGACGNTVKWQLFDDGSLIISGTGEMDNYTKSSQQPWYSNRDIITHVIITQGITRIGNYSFSGLPSLETVDIFYGVKVIGQSAFSSCHQLVSVSIPESVELIDRSAFSACIILPEIHLPDSIQELGSSVFYDCYNLKDVNLPSTIKKISNSLFYNCRSIENLQIPESVSLIDLHAFESCSNLQYVNLPDGLTDINGEAFEGCTRLQGIVLPDNLEFLGAWAFSGCQSLVSIRIPSRISILYGATFSGCISLKDVALPEGLQKIGTVDERNITGGYIVGTFEDCRSLSQITIPESVTFIGACSFAGTSLENVSIPSNVTVIGEWAFKYCQKLSSISLPPYITSLEKETFFGCGKLISLKIPSGVTTIKDDVFRYCTSLNYLYIPSSVTSIGSELNNPFYECISLLAFVHDGSYASQYCSDHGIDYEIIQPLEIQVYQGWSLLNSKTPVYILASASGGVKPYSYRFIIRQQGVNTTVSGWIDKCFIYLPDPEGEFSVFAQVKDSLGNIKSSYLIDGTDEVLNEDHETNENSMLNSFFHSKMQKVFNEAMTPDQIEGVAYYQSLPENSSWYARFLQTLTEISNPAEALRHALETATGDDLKKYLIRNAIAVSATTDSFNLPKFPDLPPEIRDAKEASKLLEPAYLDSCAVWIMEQGNLLISENPAAYENAKQTITEIYRQYSNGRIQDLNYALKNAGYSGEQLGKMGKAFRALKTYGVVLKGAEKAVSLYKSISDVYNQMALVMSLDTNQLYLIGKAYKDQGYGVGDELMTLAITPDESRAALIWENNFASLGLDTFVSLADIGVFIKDNGTFAAIGGLTYVTDRIFGTTGVSEKIYELSQSVEMTEITWRDFQNKRSSYISNPNVYTFGDVYAAYLNYYKTAGISESTFIGLVKAGQESMTSELIGLGDSMKAASTKAKRNAEQLDTIVEKMRNIYQKWYAAEYKATNEILGLIDDLDKPYDYHISGGGGGGGGGGGW